MSMPRYKDHLGRLSYFPTSKEVAFRDGLSKYLRPASSPRCHCGCEGLYVETDECIFCMAKQKWDEYSRHPEEHPVTLEGATYFGSDFVITPEPCKDGAHLVARFVDGRDGCAICKSRLSPRQMALRHNEKWYLPNKPCVHCRQRAMRRVQDGKCEGCFPLKPQAHKMDEPTRMLMENAPDTVMDRDLAKTMGLTAYRSGQFCKYGHAGWRYISTRGCITCHRQRGKS